MTSRSLPPLVSARPAPSGPPRPQRKTAIALAVCLLTGTAAAQTTGQVEAGVAPDQGQVQDILARVEARQRSMEQELKRINDSNALLQRENRSLKEDRARALDEVAGLTQRLGQTLAQLDETVQALRAKDAELSAARGELQRLESVNQDAEQARRDITAENAKFAAALAQERTGAKAAADAMRTQIEQLQSRLTEIEMENADLSARFADLEAVRDRALSANLSLQAEKRKLESESESRGHAVTELERRLESRQAALDAKHTDYEVLQQERGKLEQELAAVKQELTGTHDARHQVEQQAADLGEKLERIQAQLSLQTHATGEATARAEKAEERVADLETAVAQLAMDKDGLQAALDKQSATLAEARTQAEGLEAQLASERGEHAKASAAATEAHARLTGEKEALGAELAKAREEAVDHKQRSDRAEEARAGAVVALERLQADKAAVEKALETHKQSVAQLGSAIEGHKVRTAELEAALAKEKDAAAETAGALEAERKRTAGLEAALAEAQAQATARGEEAEQAAARNTALTAELAELRGKLPVAAGGSLSEEQVKNEAAGELAALRALYLKRGEMDKATWEGERDALEDSIGERQALLVRVTGARGLYRVQRDDTLAKISHDVYGRANSWPKIYEANSHLLENPDRVFPGMTLVIP
jgi:chromosome segregation ATPase